MVLADLGNKITNAFKKLQTASVIDEEVLDTVLKEIAAALLQADVNVSYVRDLRKNVKIKVGLEECAPSVNKRKLIQKCVCEELVSLLTSRRDKFIPKKGKRNLVMFVGLQGSGKTTTCTKYAHYYQRKGYRPALVCADTFRAGAFDQLKQNATRTKVPFYGSYSEADPVRIALEGVQQFTKDNYDLIIVDTSGRHKQETSLFDEMKQVAEVIMPDDIIFVVDSHIGQSCYSQAEAFSKTVKVGGVILTKLDGAAKGGGALSAVGATDAPLLFIGTGEHFDDFEAFDAAGFVSRLLGQGDLGALMSTIKESIPLERQPELAQRLAAGVFTLKDLQEQFKNLLKMGPLGRVMSMIPGFQADMVPPGQEKTGIERIQRFLTMMDSMTEAELNSSKTLMDSQVDRVARGSGHHPLQVKELLGEHKRFHTMVSKMGKLGLASKKGNTQQELQQLKRNPKQMMQKVQQMMDPKLLQQMGGAGNMVEMIKQMGKMDSMGDFMKQMS
eukprot:GHVR01061222.1.p1 GENE.GHVR01061222.1~~GHVR01061222.1.p1  ORF type:complete len:500 (+),score=116.32 GHVR01061222.1:109-1608(+)